jgi:hypothetical protein
MQGHPAEVAMKLVSIECEKLDLQKIESDDK